MSHRKSHSRLKTWQKATALVPLALLSGAWTASLAVTNTASAATKQATTLPDGSSIPTEAIKAPASVSVPGQIAPGVSAGSAQNVIDGASTNGIPAVALAAYQRAAQVIDAADTSCNISWPLIGAIGRVESDHGRYGGNTLTSSGVSKPGIYGIPLDGSNGTARVTDTDAGQYDNDPVFDRAVGPMQFIPSTWAVVGVDGDGDGRRNPQDINDASLATAVYLCSGNDNLSTVAGQRSAVYRYNHSQDYVNLVLSIMQAYAAGDYASVPNGTASSTTFTPYFSDSVVSPHTSGHKSHKSGSTSNGGGSGSGGSSGGSSGGGSTSTGGGGTPAVPTPSPSTAPTDNPTKHVKKTTKPAVKTISAGAEAISFCTAQLAGITSDSTVINDCADQIAGSTKDQAAAMIPNTLSAVLAWLGLPSVPSLP
jgi:membrane-bound lytic murein transglycosylase B